jgi:plasmid replication initiation protein
MNLLEYKSQKNIRTNTVKHRCLNEASFPHYSLNEYQLLSLIVSKANKIDKCGKPFQEQDTFTKIHTISAKEFNQAFNTSINHCYEILKNCADSMTQKRFCLKSLDNKAVMYITLCSSAKYDNGVLNIRFSQEVTPYLQNLTERYVIINLEEIADFKSVYTIRLYELIASFKRLGEFKLTIEKLRYILGIDKDKLIEYRDFKKYALSHAVNEINKIHNKLNLRFTETKTSRKVTEIKFEFTKSKKKEILAKSEKNQLMIDLTTRDVQKILLDWRIPSTKIQEYKRLYSEKHLKDSIIAVIKYEQNNNVKSYKAIFDRAVKNNWK